MWHRRWAIVAVLGLVATGAAAGWLYGSTMPLPTGTADYPLSFRVPEGLGVVRPIGSVVAALVAWEAQIDARIAHRDERRLLLGMAQSNTDFGLDGVCRLLELDAETYRSADLPPWARELEGSGTVCLKCGPAETLLEFSVLGLSCIDSGATFQYAREYNEAAVTLALGSGEPPEPDRCARRWRRLELARDEPAGGWRRVVAAP